MRLVEIENPEDKDNAIIKVLKDSVTEPDLIEILILKNYSLTVSLLITN